MAEDAYVLRAEGIGKSFGANDVLKSASLWAARGEVTTLMGRNGSGKTTLLRIAAGRLRPDYGRLSFDGRTLPRGRLATLARHGLMFVPQDGLCAPSYSVRAHFEALRRTLDLGIDESALEACDVYPLLEERTSALSRGERVRVDLALALSRAPRVLLIDEPLAGLAPVDQERLGGILRAMARSGTAVVTSGHDMKALLAISDVVLWSVAGTTHHVGSPSQAIEHHQFRREYLGPGFEP